MTDDKSATIHEEFNNVSSNMLWWFMDAMEEKREQEKIQAEKAIRSH